MGKREIRRVNMFPHLNRRGEIHQAQKSEAELLALQGGDLRLQPWNVEQL
jgi:hypothetical protein